jgi:hypothetical protein
MYYRVQDSQCDVIIQTRSPSARTQPGFGTVYVFNSIYKHKKKSPQMILKEILKLRHSIQTVHIGLEELASMGLPTVVAESETLVSQPRNGSQQNWHLKYTLLKINDYVMLLFSYCIVAQMT